MMGAPGPALLARLSGTPAQLPSLVLKSVLCTVWMHIRGVHCTLVTCKGHLPRVYTSGTVQLGRVAFRGTVAPAEIGAQHGGFLVVGDRTFINHGASIVATLSVSIGNDVRIGDFVAIYDTDHHPLDQETPTRAARVRIEDNAWLGRGVIVLPGVVIGRHAVVAAGSVVTADVAPRTLVAGNPARPIRELRADADWRRA